MKIRNSGEFLFGVEVVALAVIILATGVSMAVSHEPLLRDPPIGLPTFVIAMVGAILSGFWWSKWGPEPYIQS